MNDIDLKMWVWFSKLKEISNLKKQKILEKYGLPNELWNKSKKELEKLGLLNKNEIDYILDKNKRNNLDKYIEYMKKQKINIITIFDKEYPEKLKKIYDKPLYLYTKGNTELLNNNTIAVIGARKCSKYGKNIAKDISYNLAKYNICIVSGLAKGIDTFAHLGALGATGKTIGVLGNGVDNIYPSENKVLADKIIENNGLLISEYVVGTKAEKMNFPERNRIISGISDGIVVVEAAEKSGALITADLGLEQGKEIYAVPGNINSEYSIGTNKLIKEGANIITSYKDILYDCYNTYNI